jgi:hypothetical protein
VAVSVPTPGTWVKQSGLRVALSGQLFDLRIEGADRRRELGDDGEDGIKGGPQLIGDPSSGFGSESVA